MVCVILIAEDEVMVRNVVRHMMEADGHQVLAAADGQEALELSRQFSGTIDLLITDVIMPRMDGIELVRQILSERPNLRVLVMTGRPSPEDVLRGVDRPIVRKPFLPVNFRAKVRDILDGPAPNYRQF